MWGLGALILGLDGLKWGLGWHILEQGRPIWGQGRLIWGLNGPIWCLSGN